jgi:hypothetical protein
MEMIVGGCEQVIFGERLLKNKTERQGKTVPVTLFVVITHKPSYFSLKLVKVETIHNYFSNVNNLVLDKKNYSNSSKIYQKILYLEVNKYFIVFNYGYHHLEAYFVKTLQVLHLTL